MLVSLKRLRQCGAVVSAAFALCCFSVLPTRGQQPDNSGRNKAERTTAQSQSEHMSDRQITAKIRRSLVSDKSLSTYGHNVKILTQSGAVILKGPVHSEDEKKSIDQKAAAVVGQDKVTDQLTVKQ